MGRLCLWELCEGNLEGSAFIGHPEGMYRQAVKTGISFHRGPAGESGKGLIYQGL